MYVEKDISSTAYILPLSFLEDMILPKVPSHVPPPLQPPPSLRGAPNSQEACEVRPYR
jgi:hypothetical protein